MKGVTALLGVAFGLAGFSAIVHVGLGVSGLVSGAATILPYLFLFGALLVGGLAIAFVRGTVAPPTVYLVGAFLMIMHIVAYADWHVFQVAESVLGIEGHDHSHDHNGHDDDHNGHDDDHNDGGHDHNGHGDDHDHDQAAHEVFIDHLRDDLTALSTKIAEGVSAIVFFALYLLER